MESGRRAVVVGGSVGGLTAALALRAAGWDVDVYERSTSALESRGVGIVLHPMTVRYFVESGSFPVAVMSVRAQVLRYLAADGSVVHESPCGYMFTNWNSIYRALHASWDASRYHLGETLVSLDWGDKTVTVRFASSREEVSDLLVCADGIASTARSLLMPAVPRRYSGYVGWRGVVAENELSRESLKILSGAMTYHLMFDSHFVAYPIPGPFGSTEVGHRLINFVWYRNVAEGVVLEQLMTDRTGSTRDLSLPPGSVRENFVDEFRQASLRLPPCLAEVVTRTVDPFIQVIVDVEVPRMAFGAACLIGDAAFVARPHAGAGTAKAAADAWALAAALSAADEDCSAALRGWERAQLELGRRLVARARDLGDRSQFGGGWQAGDPSLRLGLERAGDSEAMGGMLDSTGGR